MIGVVERKNDDHYHDDDDDDDDENNGNSRNNKNDNVFDHYEVISVIKSGSMGTVSCVRKRIEGVTGTGSHGSSHDHHHDHHKMIVLPQLFGSNGCFGGTTRPTTTTRPTRGNGRNKGRRIGKEYAMKTIQLGRIPDEVKLEALQQEIDILKQCDHPNIVRIYDIFQQQQQQQCRRRQLFLIMEFCSGGELSTRLPYSENDAQSIVKQILSAVSYMHHRHIIHRDLKFENIMFETNDPQAQVKIIDFGLSREFVPGQSLEEIVGTVYSSAPELLSSNQPYNERVDLWSIGVITYMLLYNGIKPFHHQWRRFLIEQIQSANYTFVDDDDDHEKEETNFLPKVSMQAKSFIDSLFQLDPNQRPTAEQALQSSPWMQMNISNNHNQPNGNVVSTTAHQVTHHFRHNKKHHHHHKTNSNQTLKNVALLFIAHDADPSQIQHLRSVFQQFDTSGDGVISAIEFTEALQKYQSFRKQKQHNHTTTTNNNDANTTTTTNNNNNNNNNHHENNDPTMETILQNIDIDGDGFISYTEFLAATMDINCRIQEDRIAEAFDRIDIDGTGYISKENLQQILPDNRSEEEIESIIKQIDENDDGMISYKELLHSFRKNNNRHHRTFFSKFFGLN